MSNYRRNTKSNPKTNKSKGNTKRYEVKRSGNKDSRMDDRLDRRSATNDPAWYGMDPSLLRDSSSLPFSAAVGTPLSLHNPALAAFPDQDFTIPGLQVIYTCPSTGRSVDSSSPLNAAAFRTYTFVRHQNSGHSNYDAPDLMVYLLAMSQVYSYINFLQRAYGVVTTYAQKNRYLPDALLTAMGIDAEDCRNNLATFRYGINVLINKAASLCVPANMPIFRRLASIYSNIYIEGNSIKDQLYMYCPDGFWKFTLDDTGAGKLVMVPWKPTDMNTVNDLLAFGNDLLARLIQSEDMNIMSGDILKAYGSAGLVKLAPLPLEYPIVPLPDAAVLNQMKNSTIMWNVTTESMDVVQDKTHGWLYHKPVMHYKSEASSDTGALTYLMQTYLEDRILTVNSADPTPEEVMEYTRGMIIGVKFDRAEDGTEASLEFECGVDIPTAVVYFDYVVVDGVPMLTRHYNYYFYVLEADDTEAAASALKRLSVFSHFRYHPMHRAIAYRAAADNKFNVTKAYSYFDVDNYTVIPEQTLRRIHEAALMSLFDVPSMVKV